MNRAQVMKELKANGSEQTRKIYRRHGMTGELFGVSHAVLGRLKKKIKVDQALAEDLWATGNGDARVLATMIADPAAIKVSTVNAWARDLDCRGMAAALSNLVAETPAAVKQVAKWTSGKDEMRGCTGWHVLASLAREHDELGDDYFTEHLETIESTIHSSKNWVKHAMNNALINIGARNRNLEKKAIAAARRIGPVEVDHGETSCQTPDAVTAIGRAVERAQKKTKTTKATRKKAARGARSTR